MVLYCSLCQARQRHLLRLSMSRVLLADLPNMLERVAPREGSYEHERRWHDGNGHSHVRASLIGPDLFVPFREKKLMLGTWQQIVFLEFDVQPRDRQIIVHSMGE